MERCREAERSTARRSERLLSDLTTKFHEMCPEYVDTPENSAALRSYLPATYYCLPSAEELRKAFEKAIADGKITLTSGKE